LILYGQHTLEFAYAVYLLEAAVLGWKGAAFAAFGEIVEDFFREELEDVGEDPFDGSKDGVKLGESTLKRFLLALPEVLR
jgi:hypothetical protein